MLEIHELQRLVALAEHGSLSAAAARLNISQPVLSRSMRHIEDKLGLSLFSRSGGNRIELNEVGELAVNEARGVLMLIDAMELHLAAFAEKLSTVRVGSCSPLPMIAVLKRLAELYPTATLTSGLKDVSALTEGLKSGDYTYVITDRPIEEDGVVSELYDSEQLHVSVPLDHRLSARDTVSLSDLEGETMLSWEQSGIWKKVHEELKGKVKFISVQDNSSFFDLARVSNLPCFASNLTGSYSTPGNPRVEIPLSFPGAITDYYICCAEKDREQMKSLLPAPVYAP